MRHKENGDFQCVDLVWVADEPREGWILPNGSLPRPVPPHTGPVPSVWGKSRTTALIAASSAAFAELPRSVSDIRVNPRDISARCTDASSSIRSWQKSERRPLPKPPPMKERRVPRNGNFDANPRGRRHETGSCSGACAIPARLRGQFLFAPSLSRLLLRPRLPMAVRHSLMISDGLFSRDVDHGFRVNVPYLG